MKTKNKSGISYLFELAGKYKLYMALSAVFSVLCSLTAFVPYVMVYKTLLFLFEGNVDYTVAMRYGLIATVAIIVKFALNILSGTFSHIAAFNTLYNVRIHISRHIAKINLGFFSNHTSGEIKKVMIEDVERIEKFLAHQIPDISTANLCSDNNVYLFTDGECTYGILLISTCCIGNYYSRCYGGENKKSNAYISPLTWEIKRYDYAVY